ncbi:F-box domain-containing protein [Mycena venus]|uniref:F-box domain-containing protein n=1 Tax=Mycena venus TaxID=2733690 RepID=A0A8H6XTS0_9AGAR|nr:F-box domain-containing protein [Mycena venus]
MKQQRTANTKIHCYFCSKEHDAVGDNTGIESLLQEQCNNCRTGSSSSVRDALRAKRIAQYDEEVLEANQSILYHNAAVLHGFISSSIVYSDLGTALSRRELTGVSDWKSFCYTRICIQNSWRGEEASFVTSHRCAGHNVHRIKADEQRGFLIVTTSRGGLFVVDFYDDQVLWSLPADYVHAYAHCEYGSGYLIFDREGFVGEKEVWRLADDVERDQDSPTFATPDEKQENISSWAEGFHGSTSRGHFRPWAVLRPPALTRAFRFVYPTLIAATLISLFIWDIPSGELVQVHGHAFICGSNTLRAFSRTSGRCVLDLPSSQISYGRNAYSFIEDGGHEQLGLPGSVLKPQPIIHWLAIRPTDNKRLIDEFIAVHVSACGSHLAALLASSRLIIIPFFQRIISGTVDTWDIALDIQLGSPVSVARYLAFENGRVAVATGTGLFVISIDWESTLQAADPLSISVHRAAWFNAPVALKCVSCLQMTPTGIFLNWDAGIQSTGRRDYKGDDLIPELGFERIFSRSLGEEQSLLHLPNGDDVVQLFEPGKIFLSFFRSNPYLVCSWPAGIVFSLQYRFYTY